MSKAVVTRPDFKWFLKDVAAAKHRVLMLDYDGTAAPFSVDRRRALPYPEVPSLLERIMHECGTRLIIISGRASNGVASLLGLDPPPEIWGTYGLDRLYPDGRHEGVEITDNAFEALGQAEASLECEGLGELLEVRPGAVAIHWRGLQPSHILDVRTAAYRVLNPLAQNAGLLVADFDGGVELRIRAANTGDAVRSIISEVDEDVPVAYLGDETSDEEAFRTLNGRGLTVLVRPQYRFTAAQSWLRPPDELVSFLKDWIQAAGSDS